RPGARAAHTPGGSAPPLHAALRRSHRGRPVRAARHLAVSAPQGLPARPVYLSPEGLARNAAPSAAREAPHHWRADPRPPRGPDAAARAAGAADELDAHPAR